MTTFAETIHDPEASIAVDFSSQNDSLMIAFTGMLGLMGMPNFEFAGLAAKLNTKAILLRDPKRQVYMCGIPGVGNDIAGIVTKLKALIDQSGATRVVSVGNSMGGYAAILFGILLNVDVIQSFAPRTTLLWQRRLIYKDFWKRRKMLWDINFNSHEDRIYLDLRDLISTFPDYKGQIHLYYTKDQYIDRHHALRLRNCPIVNLHPYSYPKHNVIRLIKETGELQEILHKSLYPQSA